jgi:ABC-type Fe3+ transport system substrate-binding protein
MRSAFAATAGLSAILVFAGCASAVAADQALIDAAKKEGEVVWYTAQVVNQIVRPTVAAFEKKYGIKVNFVRADSSQVALRVLNEARAGKTQNDVVDGSGAVPPIKSAGLLMKWMPESATRMGKQYYDADGYWVATNEFAFTPAVNSDLVPKGSEPKSWNDLLDPKWKGRMVWSSEPIASGGPGFIGLVLMALGEEKGMAYLRALAKQNIAGVKASGRQVLDLVIAGEYAMGLETFNHQSVLSAAKGAPSVWVPMSPALAVITVASVMREAPHPNAGKLLVDFLISKEGQEIARDLNYIPTHPDVPPRDPRLKPDGVNFRAIYVTPEKLGEEMPKWAKIFADLFR